MISEFCTNLHWGGLAIVNRTARLLAVSVQGIIITYCVGVDEEGHTNAIHDILAHNFL
jgi:hypothetical protein